MVLQTGIWAWLGKYIFFCLRLRRDPLYRRAITNPSPPGLSQTWDMICHEQPSYQTIYQGMTVISWINPSNGPDYWLIVVISL